MRADGNHDMVSSIWLRHMFKALCENELRIHMIDSEWPCPISPDTSDCMMMPGEKDDDTQQKNFH